MKHAGLIGLGAVLGLAGCASQPRHTPEIDYRGAAARVQAPTYAAPAPINARPSESTVLHVCSFSASNSGQLGANGEVLAFTPAIHAGDLILWRNPTEGACLSSGYGWRNRATGGGRQHHGIDLANPNGGYIFAAGDGRVVAAEMRGDYGLVVEIDHGSGVRTMYAHMSDILQGIGRGARVVAGAPIGLMGATGNATGIHLHYEVIVHGERIDPLTWGAVWATDQPVS